ncbi:uncharacterized protein LOC141605253 [Silene latifolia]|uniref:uncharacterized protein LOC141605253 n=1 Tax=Silene latifolia TaxID=37657 RepID=UPI003D781A50
MRDWESDLKKLNKSVSFIKDMLLDADTKPDLYHGEQRWVDELTQVRYEADDLFDEVITIANQKQLNKFAKKVLDKKYFRWNYPLIEEEKEEEDEEPLLEVEDGDKDLISLFNMGTKDWLQ